MSDAKPCSRAKCVATCSLHCNSTPRMSQHANCCSVHRKMRRAALSKRASVHQRRSILCNLTSMWKMPPRCASEVVMTDAKPRSRAKCVATRNLHRNSTPRMSQHAACITTIYQECLNTCIAAVGTKVAESCSWQVSYCTSTKGIA